MKLTLNKKQSKCWTDILENPKYRRILFDGSARSGKSILVATWLLSQLKYENIRILIARKHRIAARNSIFDDTLKYLIKGNQAYTVKDSTMEIKHKRTGGIIRVDGLDDDVRAEKVLGQGYAHVYLNEATQISYSTYQLVCSRLSQDIEGLNARKLILDCNPREPTHWLHKIGIDNINPDNNKPINDKEIWWREHFSCLDNPNLPKDTLASLNDLTGISRERLLNGIWVKAEGLVYPSWSEERYVKEMDVTNASYYIVAIDTGYNDPTVLGLFAVIKNGINAGNHLHLKEILYNSGRLLNKSIGDIMERWRNLSPVVVVDPSSSGTLIELKANGWNVNPAINKIMPGITAVKDLMESDNLSIDPSCQDIIREMNAYVLNPGTGMPDGSCEDHCEDVLRYATMVLEQSKSTLVKPYVPELDDKEFNTNIVDDEQVWVSLTQ